MYIQQQQFGRVFLSRTELSLLSRECYIWTFVNCYPGTILLTFTNTLTTLYIIYILYIIVHLELWNIEISLYIQSCGISRYHCTYTDITAYMYIYITAYIYIYITAYIYISLYIYCISLYIYRYHCTFIDKTHTDVRDFSLAPQRRSELHYSGCLGSEQW